MNLYQFGYPSVVFMINIMKFVEHRVPFRLNGTRPVVGKCQLDTLIIKRVDSIGSLSQTTSMIHNDCLHIYLE